jgi:hypothetical protein
MQFISCYITGNAIQREFLLPHQMGVSEQISLGEDLCCMTACYLQAQSIYLSKKTAYLYTVRENSMSREFNTKQILLIENVIREISKNNTEKVADFPQQLCRYSCFMCFAILAAAAEGDHFQSLGQLEQNIRNSLHHEHIRRAEFDTITPKSRIAISLMKRGNYKAAFYFLNLCKNIKKVLKRG